MKQSIAELRAALDDVQAFQPQATWQSMRLHELLMPRTDEQLSIGFSRLTRATQLLLDEPTACPRYQPATYYGKVALALLQQTPKRHLRRGSPIVHFCFEAELQLTAALSQAPLTDTDYCGERPMVVLTDNAAQPLGIIKNRGEPSFYAIRDAVIPTQAGPTFVPRASFSNLVLDRAVIVGYGTAVQQLVADETTVEQVKFGRFDMTHFSYASRLAVAKSVVWGEDGTTHLAPQIDAAIAYQPTDIAAAAYDLLSDQPL